jgi:phosphopantothenoylcysteine synthetase/decarboxylase
VGREGSEMGSDTDEVFVIDRKERVIHMPLATKQEVARKLLGEITARM